MRYFRIFLFVGLSIALLRFGYVIIIGKADNNPIYIQLLQFSVLAVSVYNLYTSIKEDFENNY
jgi:hypothetical protein